MIFTSLDLKSGYWQVELDEDSIPYTAFTVGPLGFYECLRMPFGLTNAPVTFQCLMENCLGDLHLNWCIIYLDDIIVYSKTPEEHLERLEAVFQKISKAGLKLKPSKCEFFKSKITYLGHIENKSHSIMAKTNNSDRSPQVYRTNQLLQEIHSWICKSGMIVT